MQHIYTVILFTVFETKTEKELVDLLIPCTKSLFQIIQVFLQSTHQITILNKSWMLLHINLLSEIPIYENTLRIHLI